MSKSKKLCPRCALEKIKTELNLLPNDTLSCPKGHWKGKEVGGKLVEIFNCPRCILENVKTELKNAPNNYVTCDVCRWVGEEVGGKLIESVL
ncbi:MAG: hypothetical protein OEM77_08420 [Nitrosopumilus sp.]|nr:hypothetical protein [Nitrosopumilus sp.]MDH3855267.1 hypothetical protein [Nitrosopumilus sp.]